MRLSAYCLLISWCFGAYAVAGDSAQTPQTLVDYVATGLRENPGLQAEYEKAQAALQRIPQAKGLPDPRIMATHFVEDIETRTGPQRNQLFVSQTIPWFGKLRLRGEVASKEAEAIQFAYESSVLALAREIALAYYDYAYLGEATRLTGEISDLLERLRETVDQKVRAGGNLAPLLRLEVELGKTRDLLQSFQKDRVTQSASLNAMLGRQSRQPLPWPSMPRPSHHHEDPAALVADLIADNPELKAMRSRIAKAEEAVRLSKRSPIPDPTIGVGIFDTDDAVNPATVGSGDDPWAIQLSFSIPLWSGKYRAEKEEALANYAAAKQALTDRENRLVAELEGKLQELAEIEQRVHLYADTLLPKARQAVELVETGYETDKFTILDLIDSERSLLEIEQNYWRAVADHYQILVRLRTLTGQPLE